MGQPQKDAEQRIKQIVQQAKKSQSPPSRQAMKELLDARERLKQPTSS